MENGKGKIENEKNYQLGEVCNFEPIFCKKKIKQVFLKCRKSKSENVTEMLSPPNQIRIIKLFKKYSYEFI